VRLSALKGDIELMNRSHRALALLIAIPAIVACTMIPEYHRPAAPVAALFPNAPPTRNDTAAKDLSRRRFIAEERLNRIIDLALLNNRDLRIAALNVLQTRAQYQVTRSASFPTLDAQMSLARQRVAGLTTSQWSASVGSTAYEVDFFGRVRSLNEQALETYFATEEGQRSAQIALVAEVATQYFALREAQDQRVLAQQTCSAVQESYEVSKIMFDAGANNELDLRSAEGQVQTAKFNLLTYERQQEEAENALTLLLGTTMPADLLEPRPFDATDLLPDLSPGLPSDLLQRRPDILQAEHELKAANANIGAARAAFFPRITLTGSVGSGSPELSGLLGAGASAWSFAPQLTVPIFTGGANRATLDTAVIGARIEIANYERAIQSAFREVADALVDIGNYAEQITVESIAIEAQARRLELAKARYAQGEDSYLNVLSAQQDLYTAQQGRLQAQFNRLGAQISLYQALGGGWK
jgi:multidrug efflux system outer membrane protein